MNRRQVIAGGLAGLGASLGFIPVTARAETRPIAVGANTYWYGHIVKGARFGVRIGDTRETARRTLEKTFRYDNALGCGPYAREVIACADGDDIDFYRIQELFRDGTIFVTFVRGRVSAIAWTSELINSEW